MKGAILATAAALAGTALADVAHMRRHGHDSFHQRRALEASSSAAAADATCGCSTEVVTFYGSPTLVPVSSTAPPAPSPTETSSETPTPSSTLTSTAVTTLHSTSYSTVTVHVTPSAPAPVESSATPEVSSSSSVEVSTPETTSTPAPVAPTTTSTPVAVAPTTTPEPELPTNPVTSFSSTGVYTIPATTLTVTDTTTVCNANSAELPSGSHTIGGVTTVVETATTVTCPYATVKPTGSTVTSVIETTTYVCPSAGTYTIAPITTYVPSSTVVVYPTPATFTPGTYTRPEHTVTATRTDITYICPTSSSNLPTSTPPATSSTVPATTAVPATSAAPSSSSSSSAPAPSSTGEVGGTRMGMTYSPYTNGGDCQSKDEIAKHVAEIKQKGFTHVRVYSTDCNGLEYIGEAAKQNGLKMIIGVFISSTGVSGAQDQVTSIAKWAQWDLVSLVVVGNEAIQSGYADASSLAGLISSAKSTFKSSGYTGEVTTTEPINVWEQYSSTLCNAVDIVGANLHPFFNADTTADQAGTFVKSQFELLKKTCPGKDILNLETGWPSEGSANGKAVPGKEQQAAAIKSLAQEVGDKSVFFSYANDLWKDAGEFDVERYWGCIESFV
ncbi:hypothetical protein ASPWEDRAFT_31875 [Aspergillus wentii DTO 134E9]|uniref:Probable beta-glucosidase btgE n=1 Tax=Aspergillus wentii DTO 134E9 TaxID=1073089 RepID=A0A1L9R8G3_ASPWE|nr:uncharacterized protein ASPWEDRAFT_31875 [Aspergillus wentii DTO 134E9]OJJ31210.1 hypothetical protein ASPWEDRAFT_31875 [Aspergillus wentii DTO 134E9]